MTKNYRPDIDGLRAIAVLAVLAFHAFPRSLPGGFVGVDIFFVISGYLITGILLQHLERDDFSFAAFYARRVRRIFPALSLVLIACLGFGWSDLLVDEFRSLSEHVGSATVFISNFKLWHESTAHGGYFDVAAELKPLLHLWSLGIEEQFYIVWPMACFVCFRAGWSVAAVATAAAGASFALNIFLQRYFPVADFYSPAARLWELLLGAWLAGSRPAFLRRQGLGWLGLALIGGALFALDGKKAFPGWWALLPTVGSVLLIASGPDGFLHRRVLSARVLVAVGLISYPLYLWHWPLLSFAAIGMPGQLPLSFKWLLLATSFVLATATYWLVERNLRFAGGRQVLTALVVVMVAIGATAKVLAKSQVAGLVYRTNLGANPDSLSLDRHLDFLTRPTCGLRGDTRAYYCMSDPTLEPKYVVYGDSRAHAIYSGLVHQSQPHNYWSLISNPGCGPFTGLPVQAGLGQAKLQECQAFQQQTMAAIEPSPQISVVLLAMAARVLDETREALHFKTGADPVLAATAATIRRLEAAGKKVVFLEDNPSFFNPKTCLTRFPQNLLRIHTPCGIPLAQHQAKYAAYKRFVGALKEQFPTVHFYNPDARLCQGDFCPMIHDGNFLYSDQDHYSDFGSAYVAGDLLSTLHLPQ